jgi:hypothetical protein
VWCARWDLRLAQATNRDYDRPKSPPPVVPVPLPNDGLLELLPVPPEE